MNTNSGELEQLCRLSAVDDVKRNPEGFSDATPGARHGLTSGRSKSPESRLAEPAQGDQGRDGPEIAADGTMTVLFKGTNEWVCTPGDENKIGVRPCA